VFDRLFDGGGQYRGTTTGDGIFNRVLKDYPTDGVWTTDVQDQVDESEFGGDAYNDGAGDLLVQYQAAEGQDFISATLAKGHATWRHDVYTYKGKLLAENVSGQVTANVPVLWMSYGTNASAGLTNAKGRPVLVVEAAKLGVFPENLSGYPSDHLGWALRFRHGGTANVPNLAGADYTAGSLSSRPPTSGPRPGGTFVDKKYVPRTTMNVGYLDGSVERKAYWDMMDVENLTYGRPTPKLRLWFGTRSSDTVSF